MLDEASQTFIDGVSQSGAPPLRTLGHLVARQAAAHLSTLYREGPPVASVVDYTAEGASGMITIRVITPAAEPRGIIVYYHGGGWVLGVVDEYDSFSRILADRTGCCVALVEYGLAPEHQYPSAVDDAWAALNWVDEQLPSILGRQLPLIVAGDSAGGNLAAVVTIRARDAHGPQIALQILVCPVTDSDLETDSYLDPENQCLLDQETMAWFWGLYAPDITRRSESEASPLRCQDLTGLPPTVLLTAEHDPLRDEGEAFALRLEQSGVDVRLHRCEGQMHGFFTMVGIFPGSDDAIAFVGERVDHFLLGSRAPFVSSQGPAR